MARLKFRSNGYAGVGIICLILMLMLQGQGLAVEIPAAPSVQAQWTGTTGMGHARGVILTWNAVPGALRYNIYRGSRIASRPAGQATLLRRNITTTAFVDPTVSYDRDVITFYQVTAVNAAGESHRSNIAEPVQVAADIPTVVQGAIIENSGSRVRLKTPDYGPYCPPGMACPAVIILGTTYTVDISTAVFQTSDGAPSPLPALLAGQALVVVGHKELSTADSRNPLIKARVLQYVEGLPRGGSGIDGVARVSPISPVQRPGEPDSRPLAGAIITVQPAGGGEEILRQRTDAQGKFTVILPPGRYLIVPLPPRPGQPFPRGESQTVTVNENRFTSVAVNYDSGIR